MSLRSHRTPSSRGHLNIKCHYRKCCCWDETDDSGIFCISKTTYVYWRLIRCELWVASSYPFVCQIPQSHAATLFCVLALWGLNKTLWTNWCNVRKTTYPLALANRVFVSLEKGNVHRYCKIPPALVDRCQAIIWTNIRILLIGPLERNFNYNRNRYVFIQENAFGNVVLEMVAILSRPLYDEMICLDWNVRHPCAHLYDRRIHAFQAKGLETA